MSETPCEHEWSPGQVGGDILQWCFLCGKTIEPGDDETSEDDELDSGEMNNG